MQYPMVLWDISVANHTRSFLLKGKPMADLLTMEGTGRELLSQLEQKPDSWFRLTLIATEPQTVSKPTPKPKPAKILKGYGMLQGATSSEELMRRKQEEIDWEDRNRR